MHGYLSSKEAFTAQIEYFSKFFRVTAIDLIGFGQSPRLKEPYSVKEYAEWTAGALGALGVENPHLIAHSFGCRVAIKLESMREGFFDKMLLTGAAGVILPRPASYYFKVWAYRFMKKIAPSFAEKKFGSKEYRSLSAVMKESYKKIVNEDLRGDAKKLLRQVLLVVGEEDTTTPLKEAEAYLACMRRGALKKMRGGHFAFAEYPLTFNLIAEEFLIDGRIA